MNDLIGLAGSGVIGSLFGGLFRLAPELLKLWDRKDERRHELSMLKVQADLEKVKGDYKMEERYVDFSVAQMNAIAAATEAEGKIASNSYKWVSALSAMVRPVISLTIFLFYVILKLTFVVNGFYMGMDWSTIVAQSWTNDDFMVLTMVLTYYFIARDISKYQKQ